MPAWNHAWFKVGACCSYFTSFSFIHSISTMSTLSNVFCLIVLSMTVLTTVSWAAMEYPSYSFMDCQSSCTDNLYDCYYTANHTEATSWVDAPPSIQVCELEFHACVSRCRTTSCRLHYFDSFSDNVKEGVYWTNGERVEGRLKPTIASRSEAMLELKPVRSDATGTQKIHYVWN